MQLALKLEAVKVERLNKVPFNKEITRKINSTLHLNQTILFHFSSKALWWFVWKTDLCSCYSLQYQIEIWAHWSSYCNDDTSTSHESSHVSKSTWWIWQICSTISTKIFNFLERFGYLFDPFYRGAQSKSLTHSKMSRKLHQLSEAKKFSTY